MKSKEVAAWFAYMVLAITILTLIWYSKEPTLGDMRFTDGEVWSVNGLGEWVKLEGE